MQCCQAFEMNSPDKFLPTRRSLLSRLKNAQDEEDWRVFFETYWKLIYGTALKAGLTDAEAQDVVQETVLSVFKSMPEFQYDPKKGSFKSWLLRLTQWRVIDQFRKRQDVVALERRGADTPGTDALERIPDPMGAQLENAWSEEWEQTILEAALKSVKKKVDPKHYQIFHLYVFKQWPVLKVARAMKVNPGKVYLIKHRLGALVKKEVEHLKNKPL